MKISVVTISFNQAPYLRECIESVLSQRDDSFELEYIIADPGSSDGSREIISEYKDKLDGIIFERDNGPADGLNKGLSRCTGDFFFYLNSDDKIAENTFKEAVTILRGAPEIDVLYANGFAIDQHGAPIRKLYSAQFYNAELAARGLAVIVQQSSFTRMTTLRAVGGFNEANRVSWDGEAFFDMARAGAKFHRTWKFWGLFRIYPQSISGGGAFLDKIEAVKLRMKKTLGIQESFLSKLKSLALWIFIRIFDVKRWPSYLNGRIRPHEIA